MRKKTARFSSLKETRTIIAFFWRPIALFLFAIFGIGTVYYFLAIRVGEPIQSLIATYYLMLTLAFLQANVEFPAHFLLQIWFFILPVFGISFLAQGLAKFGTLLFNREELYKEQDMMVSTYTKHTIIVGLGHLGFRIAHQLREMGKDIVAIESNPKMETVRAIRALSIPIVQDDATHIETLEAAGIRRAGSLVICTQNDSLNLQMAVKARSVNPNVQIVMRIFDDDFAHSLSEQFGFMALSATGMAAPVFAAAAAGADVTHPISIEGQQLSLARLTITQSSSLANKTVGFVEDNYHLNVILLRHNHQSEMHPTDLRPLQPGDTLAVLGGPQQLAKLVQDNQ
jgi:Trk K+ transport system NAD-binding subunit